MMAMDDSLNLRQFKDLVVDDYRRALFGREMRMAALGQGGRDCVTIGCDVAQVALARFVCPADAYVPAALDLSAALVRGDLPASGFLASAFSSSCDDFCAGGARSLSVAVGMAAAQASTGDAGGRVIVCTVGCDAGDDGHFLEALAYAAARSLPLCVVLWNDSESSSGGYLARLLGGFGLSPGGRKSLSIESVRGDDYPALCRVMRQQVEVARAGATSLTVVNAAARDVEAFAEWIVAKQIAASSQLDDVRSQVRQDVERQRRAAFLASAVGDALRPDSPAPLMDIGRLCGGSVLPVLRVAPGYGAVDKAIGAARGGLYPVVEASAADVAASLLARNAGLPLIVRTGDAEAGAVLAAVPASAEVYAPMSRHEAALIYSSLFSRPRQAVVVEPGPDTDDGWGGECADLRGSLKLAVGEDATIVSFGAATRQSVSAARLLEGQRLRVDLIHLGSLCPFDPDGLVAASLRKTKRLAVVDTGASGLAARLLIANLAVEAEALRHLMASPVVIRPASPRRAVDPRDVCLAVAKLIG